MVFKKVGKDSWISVTPRGKKRFVRIKKISVREKKNLKPQGKFNYVVFFGINNPKQFKKLLETKKKALKFASSKRKSLLFQ